jgi:hypothetical protein
MARSLNTLNILHLLLVLSAGGCLYFAWQETKDKVVKLDRLFRAPLFAVIVALILMIIQTVGAKHPSWFFMAAFFAGVAIGAVRGLTLTLSIGSTWRVLRPPGMRFQLWMALLLVVAVAVDVAGAIAGRPGLAWRFPAALVAAGCTGVLVGRAAAMGTRVWRLVR